MPSTAKSSTAVEPSRESDVAGDGAARLRDGARDLAEVGLGRVVFEGHRLGLDVHLRRSHPGEGGDGAFDALLAVGTGDVRDGERGGGHVADSSLIGAGPVTAAVYCM